MDRKDAYRKLDYKIVRKINRGKATLGEIFLELRKAGWEDEKISTFLDFFVDTFLKYFADIEVMNFEDKKEIERIRHKNGMERILTKNKIEKTYITKYENVMRIAEKLQKNQIKHGLSYKLSPEELKSVTEAIIGELKKDEAIKADEK